MSREAEIKTLSRELFDLVRVLTVVCEQTQTHDEIHSARFLHTNYRQMIPRSHLVPLCQLLANGRKNRETKEIEGISGKF